MDSPILTVGPALAPTHHPDLRPTADAAAVARDTTPDVPLAIPATQAQNGAVNEARIADAGRRAADGDRPVERVLKPFGVIMLPDGPQRTAAEASQEAADPADGEKETATDL